MLDARQIANWFVRRAAREGKFLSIMQLLKLTYIAHGWHLEMTNSPLFKNKIEAWRHGPVIPDVYHAFRPQGVTITEVLPQFPNVPENYETFLDQVFGIYGSMSPFVLSELTHQPGGPWATATERFGWFAPITDDIIRPHYVEKRAKAQTANAK